jgi:hypothetical protein
MNNFKATIIVLALMALAPFAAQANNLQAYEQLVDDIDAVQAMAFANQWKWTQNDITSYVTPQEVVFEFPNKRVKKVSLPEDKMVVAVAPYLTYTHG